MDKHHQWVHGLCRLDKSPVPSAHWRILRITFPRIEHGSSLKSLLPMRLLRPRSLSSLVTRPMGLRVTGVRRYDIISTFMQQQLIHSISYSYSSSCVPDTRWMKWLKSWPSAMRCRRKGRLWMTLFWPMLLFRYVRCPMWRVPKNKVDITMQRGIAKPLCDKPNAKGGDTGFWKKVNKKLKQLAREHGEDLQSPSWKTWVLSFYVLCLCVDWE